MSPSFFSPNLQSVLSEVRGALCLLASELGTAKLHPHSSPVPTAPSGPPPCTAGLGRLRWPSRSLQVPDALQAQQPVSSPPAVAVTTVLQRRPRTLTSCLSPVLKHCTPVGSSRPDTSGQGRVWSSGFSASGAADPHQALLEDTLAGVTPHAHLTEVLPPSFCALGLPSALFLS